MFARQALLPGGWAENVTVSVSADGSIDSVSTDGRIPDSALDLLLPAPVNLHSHAFQRAMAGLTEMRTGEDSFWSWRQLMYSFLDQLTPVQVERVAALAFMEMLEAGFAAVVEFHYLHHQPDGSRYPDPGEMCGRIIAAAERTGIGLTLLPVFYRWAGCDRRPVGRNQCRFACGKDGFLELYESAAVKIAKSKSDFALGAAAHSLRAVDPEGIAHALAAAGDGPFHIHAAEQTAEVNEVEQHLGARPVEYLLRTYDVGQNWCVIHATHMTESETIALAASGATAGLCPITESNLGDGIFNGALYAEQGGRFGIGSDSNLRISALGELRTLEYSQRLASSRRSVMATRTRSTGRFLFEEAVKGGASAAARRSGRIEAGQFADLIGLTTDNEWVCGRGGDAALDSLVFAARFHECVTDVWSAGHHIVRDGRHILRNQIVSDYLDVMRGLRQAL